MSMLSLETAKLVPLIRANVLNAVQSWLQGHTREDAMTWGVWERRLDDTAILALCHLLGRSTYGAALDDALGGHRYGGAS